MQFKVPQNIDMEDRIIGPLTLNQFLYLLIGGIIIYILFNYLVPIRLTFVFVLLAVPIGVISFAFAFVKIQDRPFIEFALAAVKYLSLPRTRAWQRVTEKEVKKIEKVTKIEPPKTSKQIDNVRVKELADILDSK